MAASVTTYHHRQSSPLWILLVGLGVLFAAIAGYLHQSPAAVVLMLTSLLLLFLSVSFHHLTVADEGTRLAIWFGPVPLFRTSIRYEEIQSVRVDRTTILDGWGIHMSLRGGWVWNIWGRDCVTVHLPSGDFRIGTDDASELAAFLETRRQEVRRV